MRLKMSFVKSRPFCLGLIVLRMYIEYALCNWLPTKIMYGASVIYLMLPLSIYVYMDNL